jgi:aminoglycoside phosphotransferase (APT) family kinase protein
MSDHEEFQGTMPVGEAQRFDGAALETYLREHVDGFAGPMSVEQFRGGQSNPTFKLDAGGHQYVLRRKPPGKLLPSAHAVDREYRVMTALAGTDVPVPRTHCLCEDPAVIGTAFYVMDFVPGRVLWDPATPSLSVTERAAVFDEMNRVIAALHRVDPAAVGLGDYGKPGNYFARQIDRWSKQYKASETETIEAMDHLIAWLPANVPPGEATSIVHGDYRLDNMIWSADAPRVLAVLDWELSTLGHPLCDLAYNCIGYYLTEPPHGFAKVDFAGLGLPTREEYVAAYCRRMGRGDIEHWNYYVAFSLFRLAAIAQGVYRRGLAGNSSNPESIKMSRAPRERADIAWSLVA